MALNIKNPELEDDVRWLARRRGQGITEVLRAAVAREVEREKRIPRRGSAEELQRRIQAIVDDVKKLSVLDDRSDDEIIGYNEHGHFD